MQIKLSSVIVDDQDKALRFYTEKLGFAPSKDISLGEYRWLTVVSPEGHPDIELLLEPNANPASKTFQQSLLEQGIPLTAFAVGDVQKEYDRMTALGVVFRMGPTPAGPTRIAMFEDTCGNLIQLYEG